MLQQNPGVAMPTLPSFTPNRDLLVGVLKSRTIAQAIVERFGLQARYRASYPDDAVNAAARPDHDRHVAGGRHIGQGRGSRSGDRCRDRQLLHRALGSADRALRNRRSLAPAHVPDRPARASPGRPRRRRAVAAPVSGAEPRDRAARPDEGRDRGRGAAEGRDHGRGGAAAGHAELRDGSQSRDRRAAPADRRDEPAVRADAIRRAQRSPTVGPRRATSPCRSRASPSWGWSW